MLERKIGVITKSHQKTTVTEFFELFKTPWSFYQQGLCYDIVIVDQSIEELPNGKIILLYSAETRSFDYRNTLNPIQRNKRILLKQKDLSFPVYQNAVLFNHPLPSPSNSAFLESVNEGLPASVCFHLNGKSVIRIGYDLFSEIQFLLSEGQPAEYAHIPTLDIHISIIRKLVLQSGGFLVEIPPVPYGYSFITCLTHDVDFIGLKPHKLDKSVLGFIVRGLNPCTARGFGSKIVWKNVFRNWMAILFLPGVYLGKLNDPWFDIDRYMELESDTPATFFFMPFKDVPGSSGRLPEPKYRAGRYDIIHYAELIQRIRQKGHEIGVHGIDAWHDLLKGDDERMAVIGAANQSQAGIRMHWLHYSDESPKILKQVGYLYDSTRGFNDAIGYKCGTAQVFYSPDALPELPLIMMDTALFYPGRMHLPWDSALRKCLSIIADIFRNGGVLTINWHTRSLMPERNWEEFYTALQDAIHREKSIFMTAHQAVSWFDKRRRTQFESIRVSDNQLHVTLHSENPFDDPLIFIRIHLPTKSQSKFDLFLDSEYEFIDVPVADNNPINVTTGATSLI